MRQEHYRIDANGDTVLDSVTDDGIVDSPTTGTATLINTTGGARVTVNTTGISVATTGVKSLTLPSPVVLTPGVYLVTTTNNSTTAVTMRTIAAGSTYAVGGTTAVTSLVAVGFTATRASFGALPSDLSGFTALNQANTTPPLILWFKVQ